MIVTCIQVFRDTEDDDHPWNQKEHLLEPEGFSIKVDYHGPLLTLNVPAITFSANIRRGLCHGVLQNKHSNLPPHGEGPQGKHAAKALLNLASGREDKIWTFIARHGGMQSLLMFLKHAESPDAIQALGKLATFATSVKACVWWASLEKQRAQCAEQGNSRQIGLRSSEDMVRGGATTPSKRKEKEGAPFSAEDKAEEVQSKRLRDLAFSRRLLSRARSHARHPSLPSKSILNSDGRDVVKKGHRKSKYLFAFPGLLSPVAGGKLGELTNLDSKNPVLYVEFPQGRLKMFGTIVYPKNKYLTLHFPRGGGNIVCEDCFESLIVFSQAWWIGTKEQNPEEVRLSLPKSLEQEKNAEFDFTAGAGQTKDSNKSKHQLEKSEVIPPTTSIAKPEISEAESTGKESDAQVVSQSVRHSARTAGRTLKYADSSSDSQDANSDESPHVLSTRGKQQLQTPKGLSDKVDLNTGVKAAVFIDIDDLTPKKQTPGSAKAVEKDISGLKPLAVTAKTPLKPTTSKPSVLKQSLIQSFCQSDPALQEAAAAVDMETTIDPKDGGVVESLLQFCYS
ncbi:hypothetical protein L7F22_017654 [Adiantum nelumboides]|nr:hypothetical protein [Adiantum nelumboides]